MEALYTKLKEKHLNSKWHGDGSVLVSGEDMVTLLSAISADWVKETIEKPSFGKHVLCWCRIYGFYIGSFEQILDTGWGNWSDGKDAGVLPPLFWRELPQPPTEKP